VKLCHELRSAKPRQVLSGDDQSDIAGKERLLHQAKSFGGIGNPIHVTKSLLKGRLAKRGTQRIVVDK